MLAMYPDSQHSGNSSVRRRIPFLEFCLPFLHSSRSFQSFHTLVIADAPTDRIPCSQQNCLKVLEIDLPCQRIALSMRLADDLPNPPRMARIPASARLQKRQRSQPEPTGAMASAFTRLKR